MTLGGFVRKNLWPSLLGGGGAMIGVWGFLGDAQSLWTAGIKPDYLQLSGFLIFIVATVSVLHRQHQLIEERTAPALPRAPANPPKVAEPPRTPEERARSRVESKWRPDMTMVEVADYLAQGHAYRNRFGGTDERRIASAIHTALYKGTVTAWGRVHPDAEEFQIATGHWNHAELERVDGYALLRQLQLPVYNIRFARGEIEAAWPNP